MSTEKKKRGRKTVEIKKKTYSICLSEDEFRFFKEKGRGSPSKGVQAVAREYRELSNQ